MSSGPFQGIQAPSDGCSYRDGIDHYTRVIATDPQRRRDAAVGLLGWLVSTDYLSTQPGAGDLYWVWATLEDVADLYDDEASFADTAQVAADEWLSLVVDDEQGQGVWVQRWTAWLEQYTSTHSTRLRGHDA